METGSIWEHWPTGGLYEIVDCNVEDKTMNKKGILYKSVENGKLFFRQYDDFHMKFKIPKNRMNLKFPN